MYMRGKDLPGDQHSCTGSAGSQLVSCSDIRMMSCLPAVLSIFLFAKVFQDHAYAAWDGRGCSL